MHLIEITDFLKDLPAVNRCSGTGRKDVARTVIAFDFLSHAPLVSPAHDAVHIAAIIHQLLMVKLDHLRTDGKDLRRSFYGL